MPLGQEFSTGGKALKSNLIEKRLDYIKTFTEHLLTVGAERFYSAALYSSVTSTTVYTVPSNIISYLLNLNHTGLSDFTTFVTSNVYLDGLDKLSVLELKAGVSEIAPSVANISYNPPIKLTPGRIMQLAKSTNSVVVEVECNIRVIEVPKELNLS